MYLFRNVARATCALYFSVSLLGALDLHIEAEPEAPAPVGSLIGVVAEVSGASSEVWYRFRVRHPDSADFRMLRDFSPSPSLNWLPGLREGVYELEVTARERATGASAVEIRSFEVSPRANGGEPVLTPTSNELVYLYSAPPCPRGAFLTVTFTGAEGTPESTPPLDCVEGVTRNVYLAGLRPETQYRVRHVIRHEDGSEVEGPELSLCTGALSFSPATTQTRVRGQGAAPEAVLYQNRLFEYSVATDASDQVIWYLPETIPYLVGAHPGGYFFALMENSAGTDTDQKLRVIDLAGNTLLETNAARVNEQLEAMGIEGRMTSFHHDARRLPNGKILVLAATERKLANVQGPDEVPILGDMILVLSRDLEVEWVWDAFDHLDPSRAALLDEKCERGGGGCPVFYLGVRANDWLHGNSAALTPDGNIVYSARHQDWIVKIEYANGTGNGQVLWRLGRGGDLILLGPAGSNWFSHQHDATFINGTDLLVFDNGNTRRYYDATARSRGQVYRIDEASRTARLIFDVDLGEYAFALGSAQQLSNGNFHFGLGWTPSGGSQSLEYRPDGALVSRTDAATQQYRSLKMRSLYEP